MLLLVDQYIFKFVFRKSLTLCLEFPSSVHLKGDTPWRLFLNSIHYDLFWFVYLIFYGLSGSNSIWRSFAKTQSWNVSFAPLCPSMILLLFNLIILLFSCGQFCVRPISVERGQGRWGVSRTNRGGGWGLCGAVLMPGPHLGNCQLGGNNANAYACQRADTITIGRIGRNSPVYYLTVGGNSR